MGQRFFTLHSQAPASASTFAISVAITQLSREGELA